MSINSTPWKRALSAYLNFLTRLPTKKKVSIHVTGWGDKLGHSTGESIHSILKLI